MPHVFWYMVWNINKATVPPCDNRNKQELQWMDFEYLKCVFSLTKNIVGYTVCDRDMGVSGLSASEVR